MNVHSSAAAALPDTPPDTAHDLKRAMRSLAGGVAVITAGEGEDRSGATVTSAHSFSMEPPTMIVNINLATSTYPLLRRYGHFGVNVLASGQQEIADRFAGRGGLKGAERYAGADWTRLHTGAPLLVGALAAIDCEIEEIIERHSHAILLGRVRGVLAGTGRSLLYAEGGYGSFAPKASADHVETR